MKHLLILLVIAVAGYTGWQFLSPIERRHASRLITRHGLRLGAIVAVILLLVVAAFYLQSSPILVH